MNKKLPLITMVLGLLGTPFVDSIAQVNGMTYEQKLAACAACHGTNGEQPVIPSYPILAGQYADYLINSLHAYKTGRRNHPVMNAQVKLLGLTDSDIKRLGQHFSKKKSLKGLAE